MNKCIKKRCSYHLICKRCAVDLDGVWFDDLDEGLALSGFFAPKKMNPVGRVFWLFPELNAAAFARRLGIPQPLFAAYVNRKDSRFSSI